MGRRAKKLLQWRRWDPGCEGKEYKLLDRAIRILALCINGGGGGGGGGGGRSYAPYTPHVHSFLFPKVTKKLNECNSTCGVPRGVYETQMVSTTSHQNKIHSFTTA